MSGEPSLGKRKRQNTRRTPPDEDLNLVSKKQKVDITPSSASRKSRTKPVRSIKQTSRETIHEEEQDENPAEAGDPDKVSRSPSTPRAVIDNTFIRIGPPRRRKKTLPPATTFFSPRAPSPPFRHLREEEEETTQEAAGIIPHLSPSPRALKKKKRRLKPPSDVRPRLPVLAAEALPVPPSRDPTQEPQKPSDQEGPLEADLPPPDQDDEPTEPPPDPTPPIAARQRTPTDSPVDDAILTPTPPRANKSTKRLGPVPRLESSHLKQYSQVADTTSVIDEFSPKKPFSTQDGVESPIHDSQVRGTATKPIRQSPDPRPADDPLDVDISQKMQDAQDAYFDFDGRASGDEVLDQEPLTTVSDAGQPVLPPL